MRYVNLPVGGTGQGYNAAGLVEYHDDLIAAINYATENNGHVLFHCRTGYRTGAYPTALLAAINSESAADIRARMANLGYDDAGYMQIMLNVVDEVTWTGSIDSTTNIIEGTLVITPPPEDSQQSSASAAAASLLALLAATLAALY